MAKSTMRDEATTKGREASRQQATGGDGRSALGAAVRVAVVVVERRWQSGSETTCQGQKLLGLFWRGSSHRLNQHESRITAGNEGGAGRACFNWGVPG
jgi:hypothetical protein